jgi:histone-lysine N-methyltransferase SETMAR
MSVLEFLASKQITVLDHPPYSPDLAPNDIFLFRKEKKILKGRHFDDIDDIRSNTMVALRAIPQNQFQNSSQGKYFEGDHSDIQQ